MTESTKPIKCHCVRRMIEDMTMRKLSQSGTQSQYIREVKNLAGYLERSPDTATVEDLRCYQLHLVETGLYPGPSVNAGDHRIAFFLRGDPGTGVM